MSEILAENLSGKAVMGSDGTELGMLYNITMNLKTGELADLLVEPDEQLDSDSVEFDSDEQGAGESTCYDGCAESWPPLTVDGEPSGGVWPRRRAP